MTNETASLKDRVDTIVVIPALNEADHIEAVITSLLPIARAEIWVMDGGSDDETAAIVEEIALRAPRVKLFHNPGKTQAAAVNLAAAEAAKRGGVRYLIRADAHAGYPEGWARRLIETAQAENADSVVVPMRTRGGCAMRDASSDLFNSWLGNGGAAHRTGEARGFVDHGHHALFRLDAFMEAGGYDPAFFANEDAELDMRLGKLGRRIFLENRAAIDYFPRNRLFGVCQQFFRNGKFRLCTSLKHGGRLRLRQLAPMALSAGLFGFFFMSAVIHPVFLAPVAAYVALIFASAFMIATKKSWARVKLIALTAMTAHLAFGFGALSTLASHLQSRLAFPARAKAQA